jgi:hypothetical protein
VIPGPFLFSLDSNGVKMRKLGSAAVAATNASSRGSSPDNAPTEMVCAALALALLVLLARIASIW